MPTGEPGYFIETFSASGTAFGYAIEEKVHSETTPYQRLDIYRTTRFGHLMTLDDAVMLTEGDEFLYHEALAHVPLAAHPDPRRVLVIGGGDGGTVREALRHPGVEHVELAEIDERVVETSKAYFPGCAGCLDDPRVRVNIGDGVARAAELAEAPDAERPDVILVDSTDPVGPAAALFEAPFFADLAQALRGPGIIALQAGPGHFAREELLLALRNAQRVFDNAEVYTAPVLGYPGGLWTFVIATHGERALCTPARAFTDDALRWYSPEIHRAAFVLPPFLARDVTATPAES